MRKSYLALPFLTLAACGSWTPLDDCKRDVFFEGLETEKQIATTRRNLDRGYGVGWMEDNDFWKDNINYRSRCQSVAPDGTIAEYSCNVVLNGNGAPGSSEPTQRVPISMRVEQRIQARLIERLGGDTRAATEAFVAREFAKCEQANPSYVGQDEWFSRDGAQELSTRQ